jgi:hypothetical protein
MSNRLAACMGRLGINAARATRVLARDILVCENIVMEAQETWEESEAGSCCKPIFTSAHDYAPPACSHLLRLWNARDYLSLARAGAPATDAYPCSCGGSGIYYGRGVIENGVFKGHTGDCYRCAGKGWQTPADHKRNEYYDAHVRRIYA